MEFLRHSRENALNTSEKCDSMKSRKPKERWNGKRKCADFYISVPTMNNNNNQSSVQAVVNYVKQYAKRT